MQEVEAICDRVIIINKGNIVADDSLSNLQKGTSDNHIVLVTFKESVDINLLNTLKEVAGVEQLSAANFQLTTINPESVRKQLLQLSIDNNLNIVSLQSQSNSLEEVFRSLTVN
jgi:ABC-2 type transport system ATP-binding protein